MGQIAVSVKPLPIKSPQTCYQASCLCLVAVSHSLAGGIGPEKQKVLVYAGYSPPRSSRNKDTFSQTQPSSISLTVICKSPEQWRWQALVSSRWQIYGMAPGLLLRIDIWRFEVSKRHDRDNKHRRCALGPFTMRKLDGLSHPFVSLLHTWNGLKEEEVIRALFTSDGAKGTQRSWYFIVSWTYMTLTGKTFSWFLC